MKALCLSILLVGFFYANAQHVGPPRNVGREYGNPKMPLLVSHLAGANRERLKRATKNSRHSVFSRIVCFRKLCRIQSGHSASLNAISYKKFRRKIKRNARKGLYKRPPIDSVYQTKPPAGEMLPVVSDTTPAARAPVIKGDSLIVLGAEVLFEINRTNLRSEHLPTLNSIVDYLLSHPERSVKISGHTDNTGTEQHNLTLSKRRAELVADYLIDKGVDSTRLQTFGLGSTKPIATNVTDEGRRKNRRVELLIHDAQ